VREGSCVSKREMKSASYLYVVYPGSLYSFLRSANDIGVIDLVGPALMAEIPCHRRSEFREFTNRQNKRIEMALNSLELEFVDS